MDKVIVSIEKEGETRHVSFSVSRSHDIMIADLFDNLPQEREEYLLGWLEEKSTTISKMGQEWRMWVPHNKDSFAELYDDIPEEFDDIFHAAFLHAQELHIEKGESMIVILYSE